jgi:hypothetical protein
MINTELTIPKYKDRILLVGSGFSLDMVNLNDYITDSTLIICVNAGITKVPWCDYFIVSNWYTFRQELAKYIKPHTCVICDSDISTKGTKFLKEPLTDLMQRSIRKYKPLFFDVKFNLDLLNYSGTFRLQEERIIYGLKGSSTFPFALANYFIRSNQSFKPHMFRIYYTGFDFAYIRREPGRYYYPNAVYDSCIEQRQNEIVPKDFNYDNAGLIHSGQFLQHTIAIMLLCKNNWFKTRLNSLSLMAFEDIDISKIERLYDLVYMQNKKLMVSHDWQYKRKVLIKEFEKVFGDSDSFFNEMINTQLKALKEKENWRIANGKV